MKERIKKELRRQLAHALGVALVPLAFLFGKFPVAAASLIFALIVFFLAEHRKNNSDAESSPKRSAEKGASRYGMNSIHAVFQMFDRSGGNYRGAFYFYLASAVSLFLFSRDIAALSIAVLALGDSFSTAAGIFGKRRIFYNRKKTWEGTLSGFAAAFAGCLLISPAQAPIAAFVGMLAESLPLKIDDNLTMPLLTGLALSIIAAF